MLIKKKQSAIKRDNSSKGISYKSDKKQHLYSDPSQQYNINIGNLCNNDQPEVRSIKCSKKMKPQFLLYNRMQEKLQRIQQKIQELKVNIHKRKVQRMRRNAQRNQQLKQQKDNKSKSHLNQGNNQMVKLIQSQQVPNQQINKIEKKVKEDQVVPQIKDDPINQEEKKSYQDINKYITQQLPTHNKPKATQGININNFVTSMPEPSGHAFQINPYSPRSSIYYVSQVIKGYKDKSSLVHQHLKQSIIFFNYFSQYRMPLNSQVQKRAVNLPIKPGYQDKKTIIFDLDQTLIHCVQNLHQKHQIQLPITFPTGVSIIAGINVRPGAKAILQALYQNFQIIIFTASHNCYANVVIDHLDPQKKYIQHRLYRQHCHLTSNNQYIKDLRIINRQFKNMVLVDNAAYSYVFQPQNGIPIIPYYHGQKDYQLKALQVYIQKLLFVGDVRLENRKTFRFNRYRDYKPNDVQKLVQNLYINKIQQDG